MSPFAKKSLGQNFLMHAQTAERIVEAAHLPDNAVVLEIGPGTGMLTKALLKKVKKVVAVEADLSLIEPLKSTFKSEIEEGKLEILHADIRTYDPISLGNTYYLVANIPYYITGELLRQFLTTEHKPASITVLVQKEVAERIARNKSKESLLSLSVQAFGTPEYCFTVPKGAFVPAPSVDSAVLAIRNISTARFSTKTEEDLFFTVLRAGFAHKRKKLSKNLEEVASTSKIQLAFESLQLDSNIRPEDVHIEMWVSLTKALS